MLKIDGSDGGGSIARISLALSTITQKPFEIINIRKNRPKPGLKNQHLFCVKALEKLCNAKTEGAFLGSEFLKYIPGIIKGKTIDIDIQTAGSITLFLQSVLLPSLFSNKIVKFTVIGGTDTKWSPSFDYLNNVFLPQIQKFAKIDLKLIRRGYYPKGNGKVEIKINPNYKLSEFTNFDEFHYFIKNNIPKFNLIEQGNLIQIKGVSHASLDLEKAKVAERQAISAETILKDKYNCPINIQSEYSEAISTGSGITLWAIFSKDKDEIDLKNPIRIGSDALGEKGKKAENVGREAADNLIKEIESKAPVDKYLSDQLLKYMALVVGKIKVSNISNHVKSNIYTIEKFLGKCFEIDEENKLIFTIN